MGTGNKCGGISSEMGQKGVVGTWMMILMLGDGVGWYK